MNYQGKALDDLATIADEKLCPFTNELLIEFIGVSLKLAPATELFSKTKKATEETNSKTLWRRHFGQWETWGSNREGETVKYL